MHLLQGISALFRYTKAKMNIKHPANNFAFLALVCLLKLVSVTLSLLQGNVMQCPKTQFQIPKAWTLTVTHPLRCGYLTNYKACFCRNQ